MTLLLLGKARERSLLSLNRKVVNCFPLRRIPLSDCFSAPATGYRHESMGDLTYVGLHLGYWSSSSFGAGSDHASWLRYFDGDLTPMHGWHRSCSFSVRCVQHLPGCFCRQGSVPCRIPWPRVVPCPVRFCFVVPRSLPDVPCRRPGLPRIGSSLAGRRTRGGKIPD